MSADEALHADLDLLERIAMRDASAVGQLYDRHSRTLYSLVHHILRDRTEAEDVLQEVFLRVWEKAATYDPVLGSPMAWLVKIARNRAIDRVRSRRSRPVTQSADETPDDRLFDTVAPTVDPERAAIAHIYEMAAQLAVERATEDPAPSLRERLMDRVNSSRLYSLRTGEGTWKPGPVPGTRVKLLSMDRLRNSATLLMHVDPGARYPAHHYSGGEDCYVISGEILVAGQRLHAGDFHRAEPDSDHGVLASDTGAEVLLVVAPLTISNPSARLVHSNQS